MLLGQRTVLRGELRQCRGYFPFLLIVCGRGVIDVGIGFGRIDQGWIAGCNLIGIENTYQASPGLAVLKGLDPPVVSIGQKFLQNEYEVLFFANEVQGIYERIFIQNNCIDCYQAVGMPDKVGLMYGYIKERKNIAEIKNRLCGNYGEVNLVS